MADTKVIYGYNFVAPLKKKRTILMSFLACNVLPLLMAQCFPINRITASSLDSVRTSGSDILKTISSLDVNKAHGHDDISIRMLKICDDAIVEPLKILFLNSVSQAVFPRRWKIKALY